MVKTGLVTVRSLLGAVITGAVSGVLLGTTALTVYEAVTGGGSDKALEEKPNKPTPTTNNKPNKAWYEV